MDTGDGLGTVRVASIRITTSTIRGSTVDSPEVSDVVTYSGWVEVRENASGSMASTSVWRRTITRLSLPGDLAGIRN
jgi:hypothetical protein